MKKMFLALLWLLSANASAALINYDKNYSLTGSYQYPYSSSETVSVRHYVTLIPWGDIGVDPADMLRMNLSIDAMAGVYGQVNCSRSANCYNVQNTSITIEPRLYINYQRFDLVYRIDRCGYGRYVDCYSYSNEVRASNFIQEYLNAGSGLSTGVTANTRASLSLDFSDSIFANALDPARGRTSMFLDFKVSYDGQVSASSGGTVMSFYAPYLNVNVSADLLVADPVVVDQIPGSTVDEPPALALMFLGMLGLASRGFRSKRSI